MPDQAGPRSIVPNGADQTAVPRGLVVDDFGRSGRVYRETDVETADLENPWIPRSAEGQYKKPGLGFRLSTPAEADRRTPPKISPKIF